MDKQIKQFKESVDGWIKQINSEVSSYKQLPAIVGENTDNIQHNYELVYELKEEIEELKKELNALKLVQLVSLKKQAAI